MEAANNGLQGLLTEKDVAKIVGLSVATIRRRRLFKQVGARPLMAGRWRRRLPSWRQTPAKLPVQQPARFEFAIDVKTAKVLRTVRAFCA